ncbi:winged helix-turn-helix domain-containing protein [Colwellia sp. MSW7]|uniref:Winged helix-turn-helix domain-containing protein n=1 Tax=Colwellia maritima TaxID=2912588 RepID=A0ABS9X0V9_9GAMM|nr:winged helix-turn-helix domain-containing protein [Colwellia maritima]MCI2283810.1 winged helix-turn-helix domain-containing protein [Colwellia maritima]
MIDTQQPFNIANITIYPKTDEMSCDGTTIEIKSMAMKMICFFASHHDEVITRDNLRASIWQNSNASDHTINNHIYSLRQIFAKFDDQTKFFHTVTGSKSGYRLLAEVTQENVDTGDNSDDALLAKINTNLPPQRNTEKPSSLIIQKVTSLSYLMKLLLLVGVVLIFLLSLRLFTNEEPKYDSLSSLTAMIGREQNPKN